MRGKVKEIQDMKGIKKDKTGNRGREGFEEDVHKG